MKNFHKCARGKLVGTFNHGLPCFTSLSPNLVTRKNPCCFLMVNQSILAPQFLSIQGLNLVNLCLRIRWRLESPYPIALTNYFHRRLVWGTLDPLTQVTYICLSCNIPSLTLMRVRGWSHRPVPTPSLSISSCNDVKVVSQHLLLNIIPINFIARTERKVWYDQARVAPC